jgi:hypothetical protein
MKPIPKELQAYFPKVINADRPWWDREDVAMGFFIGTQWSRPDGYETTDISEREEIDKANPLPPPPILVGQVWAGVGEDGMVAFEILTIGPARDGGAEVYAWGLNVATPIADLIERGYLLRCPYSYAPWSGVEVAP